MSDRRDVYEFIRAASLGNVKRVRELLTAGTDVNASLDNGAKALISAVNNGHTNVVRLLLKWGADPSTRVATVKRSGIQFDVDALALGAWEGYFEIVRLLIKAGAKVNDSRVYDLDALSAAAAGGHTKVVRELLAAGHSVEGRVGHEALAKAIAEKKQQTALVLIKAGAARAVANPTNLLLLAATRGLIVVVKALLDAGVDPRLKNQYGQTALRGAEAIWKQDGIDKKRAQQIRNLFENALSRA
jgi:ankyrin repeat protein